MIGIKKIYLFLRFNTVNLKKLEKFWLGKKVFVTGHTGFKGSWLCIMLNELGAKVIGYSLPVSKNNKLFNEAKIIKKINKSYSGDIRNYDFLKKCISSSKPEIIIHMAAQAFVRDSYLNPKYTYEVNTLGTVNILNIIKELNFVKSGLIITSDKVYKNFETHKPYNENSALGGFDPYSNSKACAELITNSYIKSFFENTKIKIATARAGNVIGGGDYSKNRIVPDYISCIKYKKKLNLRQPLAIRPWQHVIEPLTGYLMLIEKITKNKNSKKDYAWNFGPNKESNQPVIKIVDLLNKYFGYLVKIRYKKNKKIYYETGILKLNSNKAWQAFGWKSHLNLDRTIFLIANWYKLLKEIKDPYLVCKNQILNYFKII